MKKIIYTIILFFAFSLSVSAVSCDYSLLSKLKKQAAHVNTKSDFQEINGSVTYTITIYNLTVGEYVIDTSNNKRYNYGDNKDNPSEIVISNITKPGNYKFVIYSLLNECNDDSLNTIYVNLPTYNPYYKDKLCAGIENYKLCQRWFGTSISYEQFTKEVKDYKASLRNQYDEEEEIEKTIWDHLIELYVNNYYIVLPLIIILLLIPIYIIYQKKYKVDF